jgi:hypothetical protein
MSSDDSRESSLNTAQGEPNDHSSASEWQEKRELSQPIGSEYQSTRTTAAAAHLTVVESGSNVPVSEANVAIKDNDGNTIASCVTANDGTCTLGPVPPSDDEITVEVSAAGYFQRNIVLEAKTSAHTIALDPRCTLSGEVEYLGVAPDTEFMFGGAWDFWARVIAESSQGSIQSEELSLQSEFTQLRDLSLELRRLSDRSKLLEARFGEYRPVTLEGSRYEIGDLHLGDTVRLLLFLNGTDPIQQTVQIMGKLEAAPPLRVPGVGTIEIVLKSELNRMPVSGVSATLVLAGTEENRSVVRNRSCLTDNMGRVFFWVYRETPYVLQVEGVFVRQSRVLLPIEKAHERFEIETFSDRKHQFVVLDTDGLGIGSASADVLGSNNEWIHTGFASESGFVVLPLTLDSRAIQLHVRADGYVSRSFSSIEEIPPEVVLGKAGAHEIRLTRHNRAVGTGVATVFMFGKHDGATRLLRQSAGHVWAGSLTIRDPEEEVDRVYVTMRGCMPGRVFDRETSGFVAKQLDLANSQELTIRYGGDERQLAIFKHRYLASGFAGAIEWEDGAKFPFRLGMEQDGGASGIDYFGSEPVVLSILRRGNLAPLELFPMAPHPAGDLVELVWTDKSVVDR